MSSVLDIVARALMSRPRFLLLDEFGQIPFVQRHIEKAIILVILLSVLPLVMSMWRARRAGRRRRGSLRQPRQGTTVLLCCRALAARGIT